MFSPGQRVVVAMMDGLDMEYMEKTDMPNLWRMCSEGFFKEVSGVFPSVTNVNNVSIACGAWPVDHGITANSYYDEASGEPVYMNAADLIQHPTIFKRAADRSLKSALLTCKRKTLELFHQDVAIGVAAEDLSPEQEMIFGKAPGIYSREINYWLWEVAVNLLQSRPDISLLYVHITDYPMHAWGPDDPESKAHLMTLDQLLGQARQAAPDAAFLITADHGMNYKRRCWDLKRVLDQAEVSPKFVLSPERDYYIKHHRNFTGCSWVWLHDASQREAACQVMSELDGVEAIIGRQETARRYHLVPERIGDLTVLGDIDTMFGEMDTTYEDLPSDYRAHGSLYEMRLPLIVWNHGGLLPSEETFNYNLDLTRGLYS
jgi:phosphonoacetate hydrolase